MIDFTAQCGEDKWLADNWRRLALPERGYFVDVGAADGRTFSNTHWLEHTKGWHGLLIEPDARHEIRDRPNSAIERCAVGMAGQIELALTVDPFLNSSLRLADSPDEPRLAICRRMVVSSVPLTRLLEKHRVAQVDLLSIDTEGTELAAWRTLDLNRWRPHVVIMEYSTWQLRDAWDEVHDAMLFAGYAAAHRTEYNGIFVSVR
jgi:FkbM family methyltransferase